MSERSNDRLSSRQLRAQLSARHLERAHEGEAEVSFGAIANVVYNFTEQGGHGNFLPASLRRILADARWSARLKKAYTGAQFLPHARDRRRGELECAASSDALLMNLFCYPGVLRRAATCGVLGVAPGLRPAFGARVALPMRRGEVDRTELDMRLGDLLLEAKLTETGFGYAAEERLRRYLQLEEVFRVEELPQRSGRFQGYQIIRGVLAAQRHGARYAVLLDARRCDLQEICFQVLCSARSPEARSRFRLLTWQEVGVTLPMSLRRFLGERYGIA